MAQPKGLRTPQAAGIPPLLQLSFSAGYPRRRPRRSHPHVQSPSNRHACPGPCTTRHPARAGERSKCSGCSRTSNYGIKGYIGGGPWTLVGIQGPHPGNTLSRAHYVVPSLQQWVSADLHGGRMVSAWNSRKPHGRPRNSWEIQRALW